MRRRRKRQEAVSHEPVVEESPPDEPDVLPAPALRIIVLGQPGTTRDSLETIVNLGPDMDLVGSFDDIDSGTSGIRANARRSGVVVLVDVSTLEAAGTMTGIRHLRDRFPFCRFLVYGDAFDENAASAWLFFGADGVAGVRDGRAAVARAIRRSAPHGEEVEPETEVDEPEEPAEPEAERESQPEPEPQQEEDRLHPVEESPPEPEPEPEPAASASDEDGGAARPEPRGDPTRPAGSGEQMWPEPPSRGEAEPTRRVAPGDIWDRQASEDRLEAHADGDPANGKRRALDRPARAVADAGGRFGRTLRRPFRADRESKEQDDEGISDEARTAIARNLRRLVGRDATDDLDQANDADGRADGENPSQRPTDRGHSDA